MSVSRGIERLLVKLTKTDTVPQPVCSSNSSSALIKQTSVTLLTATLVPAPWR